MLLRKIITPTKPSVTVRLPLAMVGKTVEVIAFEIDGANQTKTRDERLREIEYLTKNSLVDLSGFTFNRDEANDYDA